MPAREALDPCLVLVDGCGATGRELGTVAERDVVGDEDGRRALARGPLHGRPDGPLDLGGGAEREPDGLRRLDHAADEVGVALAARRREGSDLFDRAVVRLGNVERRVGIHGSWRRARSAGGAATATTRRRDRDREREDRGESDGDRSEAGPPTLAGQPGTDARHPAPPPCGSLSPARQEQGLRAARRRNQRPLPSMTRLYQQRQESAFTLMNAVHKRAGAGIDNRASVPQDIR